MFLMESFYYNIELNLVTINLGERHAFDLGKTRFNVTLPCFSSNYLANKNSALCFNNVESS